MVENYVISAFSEEIEREEREEREYESILKLICGPVKHL